VTWQKLMAVIICAGGIVLVALHPRGQSGDDDGDAKSDSVGIVLVLLSMVAFAIYEVLFKLFNTTWGGSSSAEVVPGSPKQVAASDAIILLAIIGFYHLLFSPFLILIWHYAGWETFELPDSKHTWFMMLANAALDTLFNICFLIGIAISTPFFMAMGLLLSIPCSIVLDFIWNNYILSVEALVGAFLVAIGFGVLTYFEYGIRTVEERGGQYGTVQSQKSRSIVSADLDDEGVQEERVTGVETLEGGFDFGSSSSYSKS